MENEQIMSVDAKEALKVVCEKFGIKDGRVGNYCVDKIKGVSGVYKRVDVSYPYSTKPVFEYTLLRKGEDAIKIFEALCLLTRELNLVLNNEAKIHKKTKKMSKDIC